jgi:hypothetical protein
MSKAIGRSRSGMLASTAKSLLAQCFPCPSKLSAEEKANATERGDDFRTRTERIGGFPQRLTEDGAKVMNTLAKEAMAAEAAREGSVISRAQALLVAQAFLAAVLALGGASTFPGASVGGWAPWSVAALIAAIVVQAFLMTWCALRALRGAHHVRLSYGDYEAIVLADGKDSEARSEGAAEAEMAVRTLNIYRRTLIRNDDRFEHLELAQRGLRNTCFLLSALVLLVVGLNLRASTVRPSSQSEVRLPQMRVPGTAVIIPGPDAPQMPASLTP